MNWKVVKDKSASFWETISEKNKERLFYLVAYVLMVGVFVGGAWLWESYEAFRWLLLVVVGLGVGAFLLFWGFVFIVALWPLLVGIAALVFIFKSC